MPSHRQNHKNKSGAPSSVPHGPVNTSDELKKASLVGAQRLTKLTNPCYDMSRGMFGVCWLIPSYLPFFELLPARLIDTRPALPAQQAVISMALHGLPAAWARGHLVRFASLCIGGALFSVACQSGHRRWQGDLVLMALFNFKTDRSQCSKTK